MDMFHLVGPTLAWVVLVAIIGLMVTVWGLVMPAWVATERAKARADYKTFLVMWVRGEA